MMNYYSLIIPIYNEDKTLEELLLQLKKLNKKIEIVIINDGSTDKTESILNSQNLFKVIHNPINSGKGYSIINGVKSATKKNIILMDGDLEIDMLCIENLIKKFESSVDSVVVGNRWINNIDTNNYINTFGNHIFNYIFNFLYKTQLKDILCCVKVLNKKLFNSLDLKSKRFSIEVEIMSKLARNKIKILEVGVPYIRRTNSQGKKLKISDGWFILLKMIKIRFGWL